MNLGDLIKTLSLDVWYKALTVVGFILIVVALTFEVKAITNTQLLLLAAIMFFAGMGVWQGMRTRTVGWIPPNIYTGGPYQVEETNWNPNPIGCAFLGISGILGLVFLISLFTITGSAPSPSPTSIPTIQSTATSTFQPLATTPQSSMTATPPSQNVVTATVSTSPSP
jgi:hypothetical protein